MATASQVSSRLRVSLLLRLLTFGMLLGTGFLFLVISDFDLQRMLQNVQETDPLKFTVLMSILPLAGFPVSAFYLFAGSAFPWWQASLLCSLALAINMSLAYPLAMSLLKVPVTQFMARYQKQLPNLNERNQFRVTFLVRSIPGVPFFMQNYMLPLLSVKFRHYFIISWSIQSLFAAGMAAVPHVVKESGWIPVAVAAGLVGLLLLFRKIYGKQPASSE